MRADTVPADLDSILDRVPCLRGVERTASDLSGGLTNRNVRVTTADRDVVVRISHKDSGLLFIDRNAEYANSLAAAESGAAPAVVDYVPDAHLLVIEFVTGRTLTEQDVREDANLSRIAEICRQLHAGPRFVNDFDMFDVQRGYLRTVTERDIRIPADYGDFAPRVKRMREALAVRAAGTVPCNNDLLAANFIDDGSRLWLIDFEYSGNNDPCFELGNLAGESQLSSEQLASLVTSYYGAELRSKIARARLFEILANYSWTLWAAIQAATSPLDFDFWTWGMGKYDRSVAAFSAPTFETLLSDAARPD